jgi:hypothetical protein
MAGFDLDQQFDFAIRARDLAPVAATPGAASGEPLSIEPVFTPGVERQAWETPEQYVTGNQQEPGLARIEVAFARPVPARCKLVIGVASGPWRTIGETTTPAVQTSFVARPDKPDMKVSFRPIELEPPNEIAAYRAATRRGAGATMPVFGKLVVTFPIKLWTDGVDRPDWRIVAVVGGKEVPMQQRSESDSATVTTDVFDVQASPDAIQAIRFQSRPYEPVVFDDVSLRPDARTAPTVTLKAVGEPLSPPPPQKP